MNFTSANKYTVFFLYFFVVLIQIYDLMNFISIFIGLNCIKYKYHK